MDRDAEEWSRILMENWMGVKMERWMGERTKI
jgi:hypothetical protein